MTTRPGPKQGRTATCRERPWPEALRVFRDPGGLLILVGAVFLYALFYPMGALGDDTSG